VCVKALCKMLMKLTPGEGCVIIVVVELAGAFGVVQ
jgi:hypothetical protein